MSNRGHNSLLRKLKRGFTSLFVCVVVLFPILSFVWLVKEAAVNADKRKAAALPSFNLRAADMATNPPKLFKEPLVSITFDDGWESTYSVAAPMFQKYGLRTTQYVLPGMVKDQGYLSKEQIKSLQKAGQNMECHSMDHADLTSLESADLDYQLATCKQQLEAIIGSPVVHFASPYGHTNRSVIDAITGKYMSHRNTNGDISNGVDENDVNTASKFNRYDIIGVTVRRDTPVWQLKAAVEYALAHNGWLVITYHQIDEGPSQFGLDNTLLEEQLKYLSSAPIRIVPVNEAMDGYKQ